MRDHYACERLYCGEGRECFTPLLSAGNKLDDQSVQLILSSLSPTSASVWISRCVCVAECSPVVGSQDGCLMSVSCWSSAGAETAGES